MEDFLRKAGNSLKISKTPKFLRKSCRKLRIKETAWKYKRNVKSMLN